MPSSDAKVRKPRDKSRRSRKSKSSRHSERESQTLSLSQRASPSITEDPTSKASRHPLSNDNVNASPSTADGSQDEEDIALSAEAFDQEILQKAWDVWDFVWHPDRPWEPFIAVESPPTHPRQRDEREKTNGISAAPGSPRARAAELPDSSQA